MFGPFNKLVLVVFHLVLNLNIQDLYFAILEK